ncbi:uncharacterized protein LOC115352160 [Aquila chrysaetos chrysaetos]|uniref:uncharacterized protein LOC115352160 n=1 Tax=Aquila chrysaetos chrysaetos TaxID=223781 RepID=UPI001176541E|nr:uncharacterized protein LOC115352160 [Aquila chrysaetos chrysaetos]
MSWWGKALERPCLLPSKPLAEVLCVHTWTDPYPALIRTFLSLHGRGRQLQVPVPRKRGFPLFRPRAAPSQERGFARGHRSATQPRRWDKGGGRAKGISERREGCRRAVGQRWQGWRAELGQRQRGRDGEFGAIRMGGMCSSLGSGWEPLRSLGVSQPLLGQRAACLAGGPGWFFFFFSEGKGTWKTRSVPRGCLWAPTRGTLTLPDRSVQPSRPARAKRRLFVHDGRSRAGTGRVGSGQWISLPRGSADARGMDGLPHPSTPPFAEPPVGRRTRRRAKPSAGTWTQGVSPGRAGGGSRCCFPTRVGGGGVEVRLCSSTAGPATAALLAARSNRRLGSGGGGRIVIPTAE